LCCTLQALAKTNAVDYDDLLSLTVAVLREAREVGGWRASCRLHALTARLAAGRMASHVWQPPVGQWASGRGLPCLPWCGLQALTFCRMRWQHVLVDEMQDTNAAQASSPSQKQGS
jgi:superfamily I DNA/RNA helicase